MKKVISVILLFALLASALPALASGSNPFVSVYGDYNSGKCVVTGTTALGEGARITLRVEGPMEGSPATVYIRQLTAESNGLFTCNFPMPGGIGEGTYSVTVADKNGTGSSHFAYPFNSVENKLTLSGAGSIVFMADETDIDITRNTFMVYVDNGDVRDNVALEEGADFEIEGLPTGLTCSAIGDGEKGAIVFSVTGSAQSAVTVPCDIKVSVKCTAVTPHAGVNSDSEMTSCATLYDYVLATTPQTSIYTGDNCITMRSALQIDDSTFGIVSKYHAFKEGTLTEGTDFTFAAPSGFGLSAVSNGEVVTFTASYNGSGLSASSSLSVVLKPTAFAHGVNYDSNTVSVPVSVISSGGGSFGGGGGGGGGSSAQKDNEESKPEDTVAKDEEPKADEVRKTFSDTDSHWAKDYIELLAGAEVVNGVAEGVFAPDSKITRAEFAAMLVRAAGLEDNKGTTEFSDVTQNDWFHDYVYAAQGTGIINGYDGRFNPNALVTREEMTKMVVLTFEKLVDMPIDTYAYGTYFKDIFDVSDWAKQYVYRAAFFNLINGTEPTMFTPNANTTRAEAATVIWRMLNKCESINSFLK